MARNVGHGREDPGGVPLSRTDAYAVGQKATLLHWDGNAWSSISPWRADGTGKAPPTYSGVWASTSSDVWVVGDYDSSGLVLHWDGAQWTSTQLNTYLWSVWGSGPDNLWACGGTGSLYRYDGASWLSMGDQRYRYYEVWGLGQNDVWTVADVLPNEATSEVQHFQR